MQRYSTQGHLQQNKDRLNIHWDTITICQLECSYCYARNLAGKDWGKITSKKNIDLVIEALSRSVLPFNLGLLGGEPTLNPYLEYIIEKVSSLNNSNKIYITTNGEKDLSVFKKYNNVAYLFSYHPADCTSDENFFNNVKYIKDNDIQVKVNIILHPARKYWTKIKEMVEKISNLGVKIHPHFLYGNWDRKMYGYMSDFWEYFSFFGEMEKDIKFDNDFYNDYLVYKNKLTNFKGWSCFNNNYEIDVYGNVVQFCREDNICSSNIFKDLDYFKRITETKPMICPYNECNCDGLLKQLKVRNA